MNYFANLAKNCEVPIIWTIFAPYHGFSSCDSHSGVIKQAKHRAELQRVLPSGAVDFKAFVKDHVSKSFPEVLAKIDKSKTRVKEFVGILDYYSFEFLTENKYNLPAVTYKLHAETQQDPKNIQYFD